MAKAIKKAKLNGLRAKGRNPLITNTPQQTISGLTGKNRINFKKFTILCR
jgi:hypothetical protein